MLIRKNRLLITTVSCLTITIIIIFVIVPGNTQQRPAHEPVVLSQLGRININTATAEELVLLPNIGDARAAAIINYRSGNNSFKNIEEMLSVPGISTATFKTLQNYVTI